MKSWWLFLIQGLIGILFGVVIIIWPIKSLVVLTWFLGAFFILEGIVLVLSAFFSPKETKNTWELVMHGALGLMIGFIIVSWPQTTLKIVYFFFALWSIISGIIRLIGSFSAETGRGLMMIGGLLSVVFGILILSFPVFTVGFTQILFGFVVLLGGISTTIYSFGLRK